MSLVNKIREQLDNIDLDLNEIDSHLRTDQYSLIEERLKTLEDKMDSLLMKMNTIYILVDKSLQTTGKDEPLQAKPVTYTYGRPGVWFGN